MKRYNCKQGSDEWLRIRSGIVTASELDNLVTPLFKPRTGEMVETYLSKKLVERWTGQPLVTFTGGAMDQGSLREEEAIPYYEFTEYTNVDRVGFVTTDDGKFGCSPDGLLINRRGLEIKCPEPHTQMKYLLGGECPDKYLAQVHGGMAVTEYSEWVFMSYQWNMPKLIVSVKRDQKIVDTILEVVSVFNDRLNKAYARLVELNGGEPERVAPKWDFEMSTII